MAQRTQLIATLGRCFYPEHFDEELDAIERAHGLDDAEVVAALAVYADAPPVQKRLQRCRLGLLAPWVDDASLGVRAQLALRALFQHRVLAMPSLAQQELTGPAKMLAEKCLLEAGFEQPRAAWNSPWKIAASAKKPKKTKLELPALAPFPEKFHLDEPLVPATSTERDAECEHEWRTRDIGGRKLLYPLHAMSDGLLRRLWADIQPRSTWSWGTDLARLIPRVGLEGLATSLLLVGDHPSELGALATLESPRVAPLMADGLAGRPALATIAHEWFARFPEAAAVGLVPMVLDKDKTSSQRGVEALAHLRRTKPDALTKGLSRYLEDVREAVESRLDRGAQLPARRPPLPEFLDPARLPRPRHSGAGTVVDDEGMADLLQLLKVTPLEGAPWIEDLRATFDAGSLTRLSRALLEAWLLHGAPPKEKWALQSLAHFPDDDAAGELAAMAAALAPRGLSARAQEMVLVLAAMQTRTSLKLVHELGRKVRSKAFRERAVLVFSYAAAKMGLTGDELAERLVPEFGLSPEGVLQHDGAFLLRLALDGLKPRYLDDAGTVLKKLPEVADEALSDELAELKKRAPALAREIAERLERRMGDGRKMSAEHFTEVYLMNGLARRVAERLVWGLYDGARLDATFVPGEQGPIAADGSARTLVAGRSIGVAHPLELDPVERKRWADQLDEQPFPQLERRAVSVTTLDGLRAATRAHLGRTVQTGSLLKLEKRGWERGPAEDGGCYQTVSRKVAGGLAELVFSPGVYLGDPMLHPDQRIDALELRVPEPAPPIALSELENDLFSAFGAP